VTVLIFGGGDIATKGIIPTVGGDISRADVRSYWQVYKAVEDASPDVVINCAGISDPTTVHDSDPIDWRRELEVNLVGSFHVAKAAVDHQVRTVILVASVAGLYGKPNHSGYCASKAGVISLVRSLGMEGHDAYAVSPGRVDTKMRERDYPGEDPRTRLHPLQVGDLVRSIVAGVFDPGDNIVIRKQGFDTYVEVDKGEPWRTYLRVGEPPVC
jgi:NAD(P)-dependent dehydrogenase (short-subunit alcohol dehydrogenase family)